MDLFQFGLLTACLLVALVAGFTFAFACIVMPGTGSLSDREFLVSFQAADRVIQNGQPLFLLVWLGSAVALLATTVLGFGRLDGLDRLLLVGAAVLFVGGVQIPTATINVPLNNQLQALDLRSLSEEAVVDARRVFERRWNRWNQIRTVLGIVTAALLLALILRL
ncbi:MAG: DUF1772 domain-containing protein [Acidobacteriota bacterium]